jgi:5-methylcytosine-specific restriction endonuclease McrA
MNLTSDQLDRIYERTSGYCHLCHKKLARTNYGRHGSKGAWEVEHSIPKSKGGTDHMNNLFAAHISCNREKQAVTTKTARVWNGKTRAPLGVKMRKQAKTENGLLGAVGGGLAGLVIGGPIGGMIGALAGGHLAAAQNPDR